jgi:flavodoxin
MKTLIVYDSVFGNTSKIAHAILQGFNPYEDAHAVFVGDISIRKLAVPDLLIVGSPTRGFRPTPAIKEFIKKLPASFLIETYFAAFDTRLSLEHCNSGFIRFIVRKGGYAADAIHDQLSREGLKCALPPQGFLVTGEEGPLLKGEIERAVSWARSLTTKIMHLA